MPGKDPALDWGVSKLHAVAWSQKLSSLELQCTWETNQISWIPLLALGSDLADAVLWANRLLNDFPLKAQSLAVHNELYQRGALSRLTVLDLLQFYRSVNSEEAIIGDVVGGAHVWDYNVADLIDFRLSNPFSASTLAAVAEECSAFLALPAAEKSMKQRPFNLKQRALKYMKDNGISAAAAGKGKAAALYPKRCDLILKAAAMAKAAAKAPAAAAPKAVAVPKAAEEAVDARLTAYQLRWLRGEAQPSGKAPAGWKELIASMAKWTPAMKSKKIAEIVASQTKRIAQRLKATEATSSSSSEPPPPKRTRVSPAPPPPASQQGATPSLGPTPAKKPAAKTPASKAKATPSGAAKAVLAPDTDVAAMTIKQLQSICKEHKLPFSADDLKVQYVNRVKNLQRQLAAAAEEDPAAAFLAAAV